MLGFFNYVNQHYENAEKLWRQAGQLDLDIMGLEVSKDPNILMRLIAACRLKEMAFNSAEKNLFKNKKQRLTLALLEMRYMLADFDKMNELCNTVLSNPKSSNAEKAAALIGKGIVVDMTKNALSSTDRQRNANFFKEAIKLGKGSAFEEDALMRLACYYDAGSSTKKLAAKTFDRYLEKFPKGRYAAKIMFRKSYNALFENNLRIAQRMLQEMKRLHPDSQYTKNLDTIMNDKKQLEFLGVKN